MNWYNKLTKIAEKKLMYHGTTYARGISILSQGFIPNPTDKTYPEGKSLASFPGSYFSEDISTAISYTYSGPGSNILFEVQIETKTAVLDEDVMPSVANTFRLLQMKTKVDIIDYILFNTNKIDEISEKLSSIYIGLLIPFTITLEEKYLLLHRLHQSIDIIKQFFIGVCNIAISPEYQAKFGSDITHKDYFHQRLRKEYDDVLNSIKDITKYYKKNRVPEPISFSGSNRILCALILEPYHYTGEKAYKILYGTMSPQLSNYLNKHEFINQSNSTQYSKT